MRAMLLVCLIVAPCLLRADVPAGWFPFVISELAEDSVANVRSYNQGVAGADGFVQIRDGHFYDGSGERLRLLATNLTFQDAFPQKDLAPKIARRMASLGINCVRFHHMDCHYNPRGIWDPAHKDRQHLDAEMLDRLDWLIYQLKQSGIYSNINLHVSRKFTEADGFVNAKALPKYDKGVDNFQARMIELQKDYARDLLTHENPYTKTRYVDEPCVAIVEINNENSLLKDALRMTFHGLPEPYRGELAGYWLDWLREKYGSTAALREAWAEGSEPLGEEMIRNRDFAAGTDQWKLETRHGDQDVFEVVDDAELGAVLHARLNALGEESWHFQIHQTGHTLEDGKLYTVAFKMRAEPSRDVSVAVRYDVPDWRGVGLRQRVNADEQWRAHELKFRAKGPKPEHTRLSFNCGNTLGDVWLADVSLRPGASFGLGENESLEAGNVGFPEGGAGAPARRDWFEFAMFIEREYTLGMYEYLKSDLGLRAHVIDTQATYGGIGGIVRESRMDFIDTHSYWQHPRFPNRPWDGGDWNIPNTPMSAALGRDTLTRLAQCRVAGMAYTVSEYDHPSPNDYRAESMPMLASIAALQDWDGIFQFCYGDTPERWEDAGLHSYFRMAGDPAKLAFFPVAANLFRRGDVRTGEREVRLRVPRSDVLALIDEHRNSIEGVWSAAGIPRTAGARYRLAIELTDDGKLSADRVSLPPGAFATSDTDEINWLNPEGAEDTFIVETPKTKVAIGHLAEAGVVFDDGIELDIGETENGWVAIALTSMDDRPLIASRRMLLVAMSKVENQNMGWDEGRHTVGREWGEGPTIAEGVSVRLSFPDGIEARVRPLDGRGVPTDGPSVWYEVTTTAM